MSNGFKEAWTPPEGHDPLELTRLYRTLEEGLGRRPGSSIAITCPRTNDQVLPMAYSLAWVGSTLLGKRVLVLDTSGNSYIPPVARTWNSPSAASTNSPARPAELPLVPSTKPELIASHALSDMEDALRNTGRTGLLSLTVPGSADQAVMPQLTDMWGKLKTRFDMIIVAAPPVLDNPTASCLGAVVDGSVLLVSAGTSRHKEVARAIELLTSGATPLLGVVMMDRRHALPRWLRRIFGQD